MSISMLNVHHVLAYNSRFIASLMFGEIETGSKPLLQLQ